MASDWIPASDRRMEGCSLEGGVQFLADGGADCRLAKRAYQPSYIVPPVITLLKTSLVSRPRRCHLQSEKEALLPGGSRRNGRTRFARR